MVYVAADKEGIGPLPAYNGDETPEEGMRRVMAALYERREPEPVFVGRYWGRV